MTEAELIVEWLNFLLLFVFELPLLERRRLDTGREVQHWVDRAVAECDGEVQHTVAESRGEFSN